MNSQHQLNPNQIITFALPYVNGQLHLGHFYEAVNAWFYHRYVVRYENSKALLISGADCHGSATTIYCLEKRLDPVEHCQRQHLELKKLYSILDIAPSFFGSTASDYHGEVFSWVTSILLESGGSGEESLFFPLQTQVWRSTSLDIFADRFVKGACSHCGALGQNPGFCAECSGELDFTTLLEPVNLRGEKLNTYNTIHLGLSVKGFYEYVKTIEHSIPEGLRSKILSEANEKLKHLDLSRNAPYFGLELKANDFFNLQNQYFYVWLDALVGYLSFSFKALCDKGVEQWDSDSFRKWLPNVQCTHFFGKDIANFHCFLWPNILKILGVKDNPELVSHGWITYGKQKLAKSSGNSHDLSALTLAQKNALRLYYISNFNGSSIADYDFDEALAVEGYNTLIVNGLANIYARLVKIIELHGLKDELKKQLIELGSDGLLKSDYKKLFDQHNFKEVVNLIRLDVKNLNQEIQDKKPWTIKGTEELLTTILPIFSKWKNIYNLCNTFNVPSPGEVVAVENLDFIHLASKLTDLSLGLVLESKR